MSKFNEVDITSTTSDIAVDGKTEEKRNEYEAREFKSILIPSNSSDCFGSEEPDKKVCTTENERKDILRFTMLFNKYNSELDVKRNSRGNDEDDKHRKEVKYAMFFNKEVTIRPKLGLPAPAKNLEPRKLFISERDSKQKFPVKTNRTKSMPKFYSLKQWEYEFGKPEISEPGMMFSTSLSPPTDSVQERKLSNTNFLKTRDPDTLKKFLNKRNPPRVEKESAVQIINLPPKNDLRVHNSLTSLPRQKMALKGVLKTKIPSLTSIEMNSLSQRSGCMRYGYWDHWDDMILMQNDIDKRLNLQISKSSNDNNRRPSLKFKKEDAASVSDSKLLYTDFESKKQIKKCDKKSRGDSSKKERDTGGRKQVQWKTEVDVIYFSTHLAANGDRTGEVIGRVMEPLREEWEQQRKGFYAKMVPYPMESHLKDRFISLLKI